MLFLSHIEVGILLGTWLPSLKSTQPLKIDFSKSYSDMLNTVISFHLFTSNPMCCRCPWRTSAGVFIQRNRLPDEFYWVTRLFETVTYLSLTVVCVCLRVCVFGCALIVGINIVCRRGGTHASRWQARSPPRPLSSFFSPSLSSPFSSVLQPWHVKKW